MTDKKISELDPAAAIDGSELIPVVQSGSTVKATAANIGLRELVTSARTYYVNNLTGNNSNNGLTSGAAFATIQHAVDLICDKLYIANPADVSIQLATTATDYDEYVYLRPWFGENSTSASFSGFNGAIRIIGDATDASLVKIKPTGTPPTNRGVTAAVEANGVGARWSCDMLNVDASGCTAQLLAPYASMNGAYLQLVGGYLGPISDPFGQGIAQLHAYNNATLRVDGPVSPYTSQDFHIYGAAVPGTYPGFLYATLKSLIWINAVMKFDDDPGYYIACDADQSSSFMFYHNAGYAVGSAATTGQRVLVRDYAVGTSRIVPPGNSWTSITGYVNDGTSSFVLPALAPFTYAALAAISSLTFEGQTALVTDANTDALGATVSSGGGSKRVGVYYNGTNWVVMSNATVAAGGNTTEVQYNSSGALAGDPAIVRDASGSLTVGKASTVTGKVKFKGTTSGTLTLSVPDAASSNTIKLPSANPTNGYSVTTDGSGNWTYTNVSGSSAAGGSSGNIQWNNSTVLDGFGAYISGSNNICIGSGTFAALTTGNKNYVLGDSAGNAITSGQGNTLAGYMAGNVLTSGTYNTFLGYQAGQSDTSGSSYCVALGTLAMSGAGGNTNCLAIGAGSLAAASGAVSCVGVGANSLLNNTSGNYNTAVGDEALKACTTGSRNTAIGRQALLALVSDNDCIGIGPIAGASMTGGNANIVIGANSMQFGTGAGGNNIGVGQYALYVCTGNDDIGIGNAALADVTSGTNNIGIGNQAGRGITTGSNNVVIGGVSGLSTTLANHLILANGGGTIFIKHDATDIYLKNSANFAARFMTTITGGSTANAPTLTTGPANGDPTKWIPIDDNGTTRYIPAW